MNQDTILGIFRHVLTVSGGALITKGLASDSQVTDLVGAIITIIGVVWSIIEKKQRLGAPPPPAPATDGPGAAGKTILNLLCFISLSAILSASLFFFVGCSSARLESGGAYAPIDSTTGAPTQAADMPLYQIDVAYGLAYSAIDFAFRFEHDNRAMLWKISPQIKRTLDVIRPQAAAANLLFAKARAEYLANPIPANLTFIQEALARVQQISAAATAVLPKQ